MRRKYLRLCGILACLALSGDRLLSQGSVDRASSTLSSGLDKKCDERGIAVTVLRPMENNANAAKIATKALIDGTAEEPAAANAMGANVRQVRSFHAEKESAGPQEHEVPKAEFMVGYSYLHSSGTNFNGWRAAIVGNVNPWLGIAADFDSHFAEGESEHSIAFGPHFAARKNNKLMPIGFVMIGAAIEKAAAGETEHGFATEIGGGLDYEVSRQLALRVFDVTASITHIGGETHVSPKLVFGVVFCFGHK